MAILRDRLPPANTLAVFEAVTRHGTFTGAARELKVSQAAVSRQIQALEADLGVALFERLHRSVELTSSGRRLQGAVSFGLAHIARAADEIRREDAGTTITVSCSVTFASYWLMSRIAKFRAEFPEVDIRMLASARVRDLASTGIDLAVRYGRGSWRDVDADFMFGDSVLPVCAPAYLAEHGAFDPVHRMAPATLLHLAQFDRNWVTWEMWFDRFAAVMPGDGRNLYFDNYTVLMHAAVRAEGVALCGGRLAEDFIRRGELVAASDAKLESEHGFYLLRPRGQPLRPEAGRFRDWLLEEARGEPDTCMTSEALTPEALTPEEAT